MKSAEPWQIPLKRLTYFIIPAREPPVQWAKSKLPSFFPPLSPPDCCRLPRIMYAEIREKEREAMKGGKKINSGEENVYPRIESLLLF